MPTTKNLSILFIAGFGPIVRDPAKSRKLYGEALKGAKSFALWPLSHAAQSCFGKDSWPDDVPVPQAWLEFDVDSVERPQPISKRKAIECSSRTKKNPRAKP